MEYAPLGDIFGKLKDSNKPLEEPTVALYIRQIANALDFMHQNSVIHRDLKLENIYLTDEHTVKIGDFGLAFHSIQLQSNKPVGTLTHMAPEMLSQMTYHCKIDSWSLGIILFQMLTLSCPFQGANERELIEAILHNPINIPSNISKGAADLILRLLEWDPAKRLELKDLENHYWVRLHTEQL